MTVLLIGLIFLGSCTSPRQPVERGVDAHTGSGSSDSAVSADLRSVTISGPAGDLLDLVDESVDQWNEQSEQIRKYRTRYESEFNLNRRVADHPYWIAETYMRMYQPGPEPRIFQTTTVLDRQGELIAELNEEGRRTWVPLDKISPFLQDAVIATEDATFYQNWGVDYPRLLVAFQRNQSANAIQSGASTITMQLARHLFLDTNERFAQSYERKAMEYYLASDLTALYTKEELLEIYLNIIYFGHGAYGVEAAALTYFDKSASDLTRGESAILAGLPQQPSELDPLVNLEGARRRQRTVLDLMVRHRRLSEVSADRIYAESILLNSEFDPTPKPNLAPHFVQYLAETLADEGLGQLSRSGYVVHSTLDLGAQRLAEESVANQVVLERSRKNLTNAALVAIEPETARIVAMVGSADYNDESIDGQFNVATAERQPGSSFKPILFAAAFENDVISPATIIWDIPAIFTTSLGATFYAPANYDRRFHGPVTARTALANSYNIPAVRLFSRLGAPRLLETAGAMGITSLDEPASAYGLSTALGAKGVKLVDMVSAYQTLANDGMALEPTPYVEIEVSDGAVVRSDKRSAYPAISPESAYLVTSILSDPEARRPVFGSASNLTLSVPAAAKTGTTDDYRDNWTVGYSKHLVAGVWAGNSDGSPMRKSTGYAGAGPIWKSFMQGVIDDPDLAAVVGIPADVTSIPSAVAFELPQDLVLITDCPANVPCRADGEYFRSDWLLEMGVNGPFGDSFAQGFVQALPTNNRLYCTVSSGSDSSGNQTTDNRRVYNLPGSIDEVVTSYKAFEDGLVADVKGVQSSGGALSVAPSALAASGDFRPASRAWTYPSYAEAIYVPDMEKDRLRTLAWAGAQGWLVSVGNCDNIWYHTVNEGETWGTIAQRFGITASVLAAVNRQANATLRPGDQLVVPYGLPIFVDEHGPMYEVEEGDTWVSIANQLGVPFNALEAVNVDMIRSNYLLRLDDELRIPLISTEPRARLAQVGG